MCVCVCVCVCLGAVCTYMNKKAPESDASKRTVYAKKYGCHKTATMLPNVQGTLLIKENKEDNVTYSCIGLLRNC